MPRSDRDQLWQIRRLLGCQNHGRTGELLSMCYAELRDAASLQYARRSFAASFGILHQSHSFSTYVSVAPYLIIGGLVLWCSGLICTACVWHDDCWSARPSTRGAAAHQARKEESLSRLQERRPRQHCSTTLRRCCRLSTSRPAYQ